VESGHYVAHLVGVKVRARIELLSASEGGRSRPLIGSFRPNHRFDQSYFVIGEIEQADGEPLNPGETRELSVNFVPEGLPELRPGLRWAFYDGPTKLIGYGAVLEVLGEQGQSATH
jgi:translation elongation factor EF-Tu-like GTPase